MNSLRSVSRSATLCYRLQCLPKAQALDSNKGRYYASYNGSVYRNSEEEKQQKLRRASFCNTYPNDTYFYVLDRIRNLKTTTDRVIDSKFQPNYEEQCCFMNKGRQSFKLNLAEEKIQQYKKQFNRRN